MKLRNKKTGEIFDLEKMPKWLRESIQITATFYSRECEVYEPVEPLIKDEKIRKAVRVWAEVNKLEPDFEVRYSENTFSLISWQACIEFNTQIDGLEHGKKYTITELCGGEQE